VRGIGKGELGRGNWEGGLVGLWNGNGAGVRIGI